MKAKNKLKIAVWHVADKQIITNFYYKLIINPSFSKVAFALW